jgi:hypothetical protein
MSRTRSNEVTVCFKIGLEHCFYYLSWYDTTIRSNFFSFSWPRQFSLRTSCMHIAWLVGAFFSSCEPDSFYQETNQTLDFCLVHACSHVI